jgi:tRNA(Ile)-lysidine synthase
LCLAQLFVDLQSKWDWQLGIAHCNHGWRADATANAEHVAKLAQEWGLPYFVEVAPMPANSEAQARDWRYQTLTNLAERHHFSQVLTGHTASDRAETLLYNLLRGSGSDGLQALSWQRPLSEHVTLVRPLLTCTRQQTGQFCQDRHLPVWEDTTNQDWRYRRNRIRQELLPYLQEHFNPQVEIALAQTAALLSADVAYLEDCATTLRAAVSRIEPVPALHRLPLLAAPLALQRRVIRQFLQAHLASMPTYTQIENLVALLSAPHRSRSAPLSQGIVAEVQNEWLELHSLTANPSYPS